MKQLLLIIIILVSFKVYSQPWLHEYPSNWAFHYYGLIQNDYDSAYLYNISVANSSNDQHGIFYKLDENGAIIYQKQMGFLPNESTRFDKPLLTSTGGWLLPGGSWGVNIDVNPTLMLLNECKEKIWCTTLTNNPYYQDIFWEAVETHDGSFVTMSRQNDIDLERYRVHLHKFSSSGEQLWRKPVLSKDDHPLIDDPDPWDLDILYDGRFIISGVCYWPNPGPTQVTYVRMFTALFDEDGNEEWLYVHGINDYIYSIGNIATIYNNYIYTSGAIYPNPDPMQAVPVLFKNDLNGNLVEAYPIDIPSVGDKDAAGTFDQSEYLNGSFFGSIYMYSVGSDITTPAFIEIDTTGNLLDFYMPADSLGLIHNGIPAITKNNAIIVSGNSEGVSPTNYDVYAMRLLTDSLRLDSIPYSNFTYDSLCDHPIVSSTIALDSCRIIVSNDSHQPPLRSREFIMVPSPVPANNSLTLEYKNPLYFRNITIRCLNEKGILQSEWAVNSGINSHNIDVSTWPSGLYIAVAFSNNVKVGSCKFIISK